MWGRAPAAVRAAVPQGERLLSWAPVLGGSVAIATDGALYLPVPEMLRLPWELIAKATWTDEEALVVEGRSESSQRDRTWMVRLADPRALPTVVYERVTSSVVVSERVALQGDLGARIVARRVGGGLKWTVTFDAGLDSADPKLRAQAEQALADLRATFGV